MLFENLFFFLDFLVSRKILVLKNYLLQNLFPQSVGIRRGSWEHQNWSYFFLDNIIKTIINFYLPSVTDAVFRRDRLPKNDGISFGVCFSKFYCSNFFTFFIDFFSTFTRLLNYAAQIK